MKIGNKIRLLRTKKGLSQSELAEVLHVTAQAISKWESDSTTPDIHQLPVIASFFGVTIDELFEYPNDLEYERIDHYIENNGCMSNGVFEHSEEFLLNEIKNNPNNHRAVSTLADLYHFHACRLNDKAIHYAMNALRLKPDNKFDLNTLNNSSYGYINDWNIGCNLKLIDRLKQLINENSNNSKTKMYLLDNLIADYRLAEASNLLNEMQDCELKPFYEVWMKEVKDGFEMTISLYEELVSIYSNNWKILMEIANRYAFHCRYEEAIEIYEKAFVAAPNPRYTDMLACIAYLYRLLGNKEKVIETSYRELELLKDEWNITKGELVNEIKRNIEEMK